MGMIPNFRSTEKTDGYSLKEANVNVERRRMIMKVLASALFPVAVVIPPALADKREDAYAGVERWSEAFNSGDVEQIVRMYTNDALVLGTLSHGMTSARRHRGGRLHMIRVSEVCTNAASRARDGHPRFAPVALVGYTAADTPDRRVSLLRAPRLAILSPFCGLHPAVRCLRDEGDRTRRPCMAADVGSSTIGVRG
jgi:hypothetical protein